MKFKEWVEIWHNTYKTPFLKKNSLDCLKYCLKHIMPVFEDRELESIKGYEIQAFINTLNDIPNMQLKVRVYLNEIMEYAYRNQLIAFNPCLALKFRLNKKNHYKALSQSEEKLFISSLRDKPYRLLFITYLYTGCRRSEVIGKDSFRVDFTKDIIYIDGTKTKTAKRIMPLFENLKKELINIDYKSYFENYKPDSVTKLCRKHCDKLGLNHICVHSLRTTFATRCLESGINPKTIQVWLGHSRIDTTMDIYIDNYQINNNANDFALSEIEKFNNRFNLGGKL